MIQISIHGCGGSYFRAKWFWHVIRKDFVDITIYRVYPIKILIRKEGMVRSFSPEPNCIILGPNGIGVNAIESVHMSLSRGSSEP